ncbi:CRISPR-associated endonuclease Cas2 [Spiroplasma sp. AdecLV25b]|uniref:CRISPR-associated endonuclease Cas2 n=1 Tax=Spiroplasma sp. AdecLV25b TaxID=3027162 RepID=UPI0027DF2E46|nr:CRISPR-associated endonuclease Cas2 [Spiroplasma sp. AdecLV25b]
MRLFVMFDLPTLNKKDLQNYNKFRRLLLNQSFYMVQLSVYAKLCAHHDEVIKTTSIISNHLPPKGNVRCLVVTEKQYESMKLLVDTQSYQEEITNTNLIIEL